MAPLLKRLFRPLSLLFVAGISLTTALLAAAYLFLAPGLPSVASVREVKLQTPLKIFSSDGKLIGEFGEKRRTPVDIENVPPLLIEALLAAEDADFFSHNGISLKGLLRAFKELALTGKRGSGGSTLTMQLTRHVFFSLEKKFSRKFNEIILAMKLERELTKSEILELYMNYMYLGNRAYGVEAAAQVYYGKSLNELNTAQMAMIAASFQLPSRKNPIANPEWAKERRDWILTRMVKLGKLSDSEYEDAVQQPVSATYHGSPIDIAAPYVAELAREKTIRSFGLKAYTDGYSVYTTIDSSLQLAAQQALINGLQAYDQRHGYRGPEQNLDISSVNIGDITPDNAKAPEASAEDESGRPLLAQLTKVADYGDLLAGVVVEINETQARVLLRDGKVIDLDFQTSMAWARRYISEDILGKKPETISDVLALGDLIRVRENKDGTWLLSQRPAAQAALISLRPENGAIVSIVGGFNFFENNFNRATQAYRQPGSNLKPFIYAAAMEQGLTAASLVNDSPIVLADEGYEGTWRPKNDGGKFYGPMRVRRALYLSRNLVSIRILQQLGISQATNALERFGFNKTALAQDLSLSLGNASVTPTEMAEAWAVFANRGYKVNAHLIDRVVDFEGSTIYQSFPDTACYDCDGRSGDSGQSLAFNHSDANLSEPDPDFEDDIFEFPVSLKRILGILEPGDYPRAAKVLNDQVVFIMDSILKDVIQRGTGRAARVLNRSDLAGKTGTTNGPNDAWFSGYSHDLVTTTWVGFDDNSPLGSREYGGSAALPIWIDYMREGLKGTRPHYQSQPEGVITIKIDPETGERARPDDPDAIFEYFRADFAPEEKAADTPSRNDPSAAIEEAIF